MRQGLRTVLKRYLPALTGLRSRFGLSPVDHVVRGHELDQEYRSEDIRFSPSGRRLVVATTDDCLLLFDVDLKTRPIRVEYLSKLVSPHLKGPHGVDWLSEDEIVVASRRGGLVFFRLPLRNLWNPETEIGLISTARSDWFGEIGETRRLRERTIVTGPGSVRVQDATMLVCCNKLNSVTAHTLARGPDGPECDSGRLVAQEGIEIPDSAALSPDGQWLAVSDHDHHRIALLRYGEPTPCATLQDPALKYPHGLCFDREGGAIFVADAGSPHLFVFREVAGSWASDQTAAAHMIDGVPRALFERVQAETPEQVRALEGGAKGIDLSPDGRFAAITCRGRSLAFFEYDAG